MSVNEINNKLASHSAISGVTVLTNPTSNNILLPLHNLRNITYPFRLLSSPPLLLASLVHTLSLFLLSYYSHGHSQKVSQWSL